MRFAIGMNSGGKLGRVGMDSGKLGRTRRIYQTGMTSDAAITLRVINSTIFRQRGGIRRRHLDHSRRGDVPQQHDHGESIRSRLPGGRNRNRPFRNHSLQHDCRRQPSRRRA